MAIKWLFHWEYNGIYPIFRGFADHYPYGKWQLIYSGELTQHFQTIIAI